MDRPIIYSAEQTRSFDVDSLSKAAMLGLAWEAQDLLGQSITVAAGIAATATSTLAVTLSAGRIYQLASADASPFGGSVLPQDTTQILQQGWSPAQSLTLSTAGLSAGQSRWVLIEAGFSQADAIAPNDPNNGLLPYFNAANPLLPLQGAGGNGQTQPTVRQGLAVIKIVYGNVANTGSETPPNADTGYVGLYLIDLAYGQTAITQGQILTAGPSVGTGVPSNYPYAPLLAGLLNSHHGGTPGQAPQINLATEVQGILNPSHLTNVKIELTADQTYYVGGAGASDLNPGTAGAPWATLQHADAMLRQIDINGFTVTVIVSGALSLGLLATGPYPGAIGGVGVVYRFNAGSGITVTGSNCMAATDGAAFSIAGSPTFSTLTAGDGFGNCVYATAFGIILLDGNVNFASGAGNHIVADVSGNVTIQQAYTISGGAAAHIVTSRNSFVGFLDATMTLTLSGTPSFSTSFVEFENLGQFYASSSFISFSGAASGVRYAGSANAIAQTEGGGANFLPGSAAGTLITGAQYL